VSYVPSPQEEFVFYIGLPVFLGCVFIVVCWLFRGMPDYWDERRRGRRRWLFRNRRQLVRDRRRQTRELDRARRDIDAIFTEARARIDAVGRDDDGAGGSNWDLR
jgi:hypothetical protein